MKDEEFVRKLPVKLTKEELFAKGKLLSELEQKKRDIEEQKKAATSKFNGVIKTIALEMSLASDCISNESELRNVTCARDADYVTGKIYTRRLDTQEIIEERDIKNSDRQEEIL